MRGSSGHCRETLARSPLLSTAEKHGGKHGGEHERRRSRENTEGDVSFLNWCVVRCSRAGEMQ